MEAGDKGAVKTRNKGQWQEGAAGRGEDPEENMGWNLAVHGLGPKPPSRRLHAHACVWGLQVAPAREVSSSPLPPPPGE